MGPSSSHFLKSRRCSIHTLLPSATQQVHIFVIEGLLGVNEKGEFFPQLAKEVPTKENGGVSADGLTVTYHLRQGVKRGYVVRRSALYLRRRQVYVGGGGPSQECAVATTDYRDIDSVTCPDLETAVVKLKTILHPLSRSLLDGSSAPRNWQSRRDDALGL